MLKVKTPKNPRVKRALEKRAPKLVSEKKKKMISLHELYLILQTNIRVFF